MNDIGIRQFYDAAVRHDFFRDMLFRVTDLGGPPDVRLDPDELLYLKTASLPQRSVAVHTAPYMGLPFNVPGTAKYDSSSSWNVRFYLPQDLSLRKKFEKWSRFIFDDITSTGAYDIPGPQYNVTMFFLNKQLQPIRKYIFYGVFLVNTGNISLDKTSDGKLVEIDCTLAYQFWEEEEAATYNF